MQDNQIRFLVATDVHLGHKERHSVRHNDSYEGFQQVISHAKANDVDFMLLGGDLFDQVNPSKQCFFRCLNILKQNVFGHKEVKIQVSLNGKEYKPNFANEDINISLPIFTIHGNHDYPTNQFGKISACDLLQASNYVNYFGKYLNLHNIVISPLIITKKGSKTKIALYGLGYIKDILLRQLFQQNKIVFEPPIGNLKEYITIFVMHQNRYKKGFKTGVPIAKSFDPRNIPEWINLTIWGHQHEAIYKIQTQYDRPVFQPGSTVLTSYVEAESLKKQCILIKAKLTDYEIESILLQKSFRPMFCINYQLIALKNQYGQEFDLFNFLDSTIEELLANSLKQSQKKPIIRIKVQYTGLTDLIRVKKIEAKYYSKVANCDKIIMFWKRKQEKVSQVNDQQLFSLIKAKKIFKGGQSSISDDIEGYIKKGIQKYQMNFFNKNFLIEMANFMGREETVNLNDMVKRKCSQFQKKKNKNSQANLTRMNTYKETEFKKSMKYHYDKIQLLCSGKVPTNLYNNCNSQQFLALQENMMDSNKFLAHIRLMEDQSNHKTEENYKFQSESNNIPSSRQSIIKRASEHIHSDNSIQIIGRSDSEDCCERASKTIYDEDGNKLKFNQARTKMQEQEKSNRYKKTDLFKPARKPDSMKDPIRKGEKREEKRSDSTKQTKAVTKNVRFSEDFM